MTAKTLPMLLLGALALSACAPTQPAPQPIGATAAAAASPEDRLVAAIETEGCALTSANVGAVLLRANLKQAELPAVTASLASQGRIEASDAASIRVLSNNCI